MTAAVPSRCLCDAGALRTAHRYTEPPPGETRLPIPPGSYRRDLLRCDRCGHFVSSHDLDLRSLYQGTYVDATYGSDGIRRAFDRITALDPARSDNAGRVRRVVDFAARHFGSAAPRSVLDVGSGLCVFLHRLREAGWDGTALDPDERAVHHARTTVGVKAVQGDLLTITPPGRFEVVTFNKVLEHVPDPVAMLARARDFLAPGGFVYVEVPDGEGAWAEGPGREEFFVEHFHVFSAVSAAMLARRAGFRILELERLREPSSKFTLRAFLSAEGDSGGRS